MKKRKIPKLYVGVTAGMVIGAASLVTGCGDNAAAKETEVVSEVLPEEEVPLANPVVIEDADTPLAAPEVTEETENAEDAAEISEETEIFEEEEAPAAEEIAEEVSEEAEEAEGAEENTEEAAPEEVVEPRDTTEVDESKSLYTITPIPRPEEGVLTPTPEPSVITEVPVPLYGPPQEEGFMDWLFGD